MTARTEKPMTPAADFAEYVLLLRSFDSGEMSIAEFEKSYFRLFQAEARMLEQPLYEILNEVFTDLEVHVADGVKDFDFELDDHELNARLKRHYLDLMLYLNPK